MNELNNLAYFLNSMKKTLPFEDENDFAKKIRDNKEFRIKVQKLVYLSKYFGWNNSYHFNFHERGPYSFQLSEDYHNLFSFNQQIRVLKSTRILMNLSPKTTITWNQQQHCYIMQMH